jgi:glycosyltransferase involved in cell wall biosynthesis
MTTKKLLRYLPLEIMPARYTELMSCENGWVENAFRTRFNLEVYRPNNLPVVIKSGEVLDSVQRPLWSLAQISQLLSLPDDDLGLIYFDDFYTPGLDALAYSRKKFKAFAFCWAQTFDIHDFTRRMFYWMRPWELIAFEVCTKVFVAHPLLAEIITVAYPDVAHKLEVVGLPFNSLAVSEKVNLSKISPNREYDVVYSSRFDKEKNPMLLLDLVENSKDWRFVICTGHPELRGNDLEAIHRAKKLASREGSNLWIAEGLDKGSYYAILASSKVQFNASYQDWVSFTLLEALTFGCWPVYPNWRSFPSTLHYEQKFLYIPNDMSSAQDKIFQAINVGHHTELDRMASKILNFHNWTLNRIADSISKFI